MLEAFNRFGRFVDVIQTRNLYEPTDIVRVDLVIDNPLGKIVPFLLRTTINRNTVLGHLILARFEIREDFLGQLGKILPLNQIIRLEEDFSQSRFANWIVFQIEFVESVERIFMRLSFQYR